jgi:hypothetical protein
MVWRLNSRPQSSVVIFFTRLVLIPCTAICILFDHLHQGRHQRLLRPLVALKQLGLEGPLSITGHLQLKWTNSRCERSLVAAVSVATPARGLHSAQPGDAASFPFAEFRS